MKNIIIDIIKKSNNWRAFNININTSATGGHRTASAIIEVDKSTKLLIKSTNVFGHLCKIGIEVPVTPENIERCLAHLRSEDNPHIGCPHKFSIINGELWRVRLGTNAWGLTTGHEFPENKYDSVIITESIALSDIERVGRSSNSYVEPLWEAIHRAALAIQALSY